MDWWLGCPDQRSNRNFHRHNHVRVFFVLCSAESSSPRVLHSGHWPTGLATHRGNKRTGPIRSVGGRAKGKQQGFFTCLPANIIEWQLPPIGSGPERVLSGGLFHGRPEWLYCPQLFFLRRQT